MSLTTNDIKAYQATTMPTSLSTTNVGGAINTSAEITNGTIGEVLPSLASSLSGGGDKTIYSKWFLKNVSATDDLPNAKIFVENLLDDGPTGNHNITIRPSGAGDDSTRVAKVIGFDSSGDPLTENLPLNGDNDVTTVGQFSKLVCVESRLASGGALVRTVTQWTIKKSTTVVGYAPASSYGATSEVSIGLEASLNGSSTTTNATTAPSGVTFSKPKAYADGLAVATGTLTHGDAQAIWEKWINPERRATSPDFELVCSIQGDI